MMHFLNQAIEMEAGAMVRERIGSAEHRIREILDTGPSQIEHSLRKRWIHDRHLKESFVKSDWN
jgi:hypothetical protein